MCAGHEQARDGRSPPTHFSKFTACVCVTACVARSDLPPPSSLSRAHHQRSPRFILLASSSPAVLAAVSIPSPTPSRPAPPPSGPACAHHRCVRLVARPACMTQPFVLSSSLLLLPRCPAPTWLLHPLSSFSCGVAVDVDVGGVAAAAPSSPQAFGGGGGIASPPPSRLLPDLARVCVIVCATVCSSLRTLLPSSHLEFTLTPEHMRRGVLMCVGSVRDSGTQRCIDSLFFFSSSRPRHTPRAGATPPGWGGVGVGGWKHMRNVTMSRHCGR